MYTILSECPAATVPDCCDLLLKITAAALRQFGRTFQLWQPRVEINTVTKMVLLRQGKVSMLYNFEELGFPG